MKQSTNYNMNKPDPNDMFSLEHWNQNTDKIDETLAPTFEDYTGETPVPTTDEALKNIKSKTKLSILMQNIKAFCKGCCTLGMLVDNCVTNNNNLPLAASQGKILMDQITSLNSDMSKFDVYHRDVTGSLNDDKIIQTALEDFKTSIVTNKPILVEIQNHLGGRALAVGIQSLSNYNSFLVITYYDRPKEFVYALNHWEVYELVTKSDLTFYKHPLNMTVKMSGKLESIAEWLKNNTTYFGVYNYIRVQEPIDSDGYFGNSSFDIVWNFSSLNYGWITLRSDNPKSIIFGRLVAGKAEWDIPVFKSI